MVDDMWWMQCGRVDAGLTSTIVARVLGHCEATFYAREEREGVKRQLQGSELNRVVLREENGMVSPKFKIAHIDIIDMPQGLMLKLDSVHQVEK